MTHFQIWGWMIVVILICGVIYGLYLLAKNVYKYGVPRSIPPAQFTRYRQPTPTIKTTYGRDLMCASIEICKANPERGITTVINTAEKLVSKVHERCFDIDKQARDKSEEQTRELFKQAAKP